MSKILTQLRIVVEDLNHLQVPWALIGALAVSTYAEPRTTRDIDVAVLLDDRVEQEQFIQQLLVLGYSEEQILMHIMPTHRLGIRLKIRGAVSAAYPVDLLFSSSGIESEVIQAAVSLEIFPDIIVPVASRGHLIAMKILSQNEDDRLRDKSDLQQLLLGATKEDLTIAANALQLIEERQFHRGKNLKAELTLAIQNHAKHLS